MKTAEKVRAILKARSITQAKLAEEMAVSQPTVARWLAGADPEGYRRDLIEQMYDHHVHRDVHDIKITGRVVAGQRIENDERDGFGWVEACSDATLDTKAIIVHHDAMLPAFPHSTVLYWTGQFAPKDTVNAICVVALKTGELLVKTVKNGSSHGLFTLASPNAMDMENVDIDWVSPISWVRMNHAYSRGLSIDEGLPI